MARRLPKRVQFENLPKAIRKAALINWKMVNGKKLPVDPRGRPLSKLNSDPLTTVFNVAVEAVERGTVDGIGLPLYRSDRCAIDIDDCVVDGVIAPWAMAIVRECDSYTEFSPSGTGLHILMLGSPGCGNHTQVAMGTGHIDFFADKGYVTLTGRRIPGYKDHYLALGIKTVSRIYDRARAISPIIKKIRRHKKLARLFAGDIKGYESPSEADLAFVTLVSPLVGRDRRVLRAIIRQSGLYRQKWDREDYEKRTFDKALGEHQHVALIDEIERLARPISAFLQQDFPPPEWIIDGFIAKGTINMVYGPGGVGKSHFLYSLLKSVDQGSKFMYWDVPKPRRVALIDTEMPERVIHKRLNEWYGKAEPDESLVLSSALFRRVIDTHFKLDDEAHQELLKKLISEKGISVVIIDPLAPALECDENSNNDVGRYMPFLTELRDEGVTVILSHHSGKSEESGQRGASRRRDYLDLNLRLVNAKTHKNARFTTHFEKVREETPEPPSWTSELMWDEAFFWQMSSNLPVDDADLMKVLHYLRELDGKLVVAHMSAELGIRRPRCYAIFKKAVLHGLMTDQDKSLTAKGTHLIDEWLKCIDE